MTNSEGFLDTFDAIKRVVSFPLEDKHVVNEHHLIRTSYDATHKNVFTWCISIYHVIGLKQTRDIKNITLKTAKKNSWVSQSAGKTNNLLGLI